MNGHGHEFGHELCLVLVRPDRQTSERIFCKIPDRIRTADRIETDRIWTDRHRTENPDRIATGFGPWIPYSDESSDTDMDTGVDKLRTVSSAELSNMSDVYSLFEFSWQICPVFVRCLDYVRILCPVSVCPDSVCLDSVRCLDFVRNFVKKTVRCLSVRILSVSILSAVRILSEIFEKTLSVVCLSGRTRTRQSCPDFRCPCPPTSGLSMFLTQ